MAREPGRSALIFEAQTGDRVALGRLLAVCQADARRYARRHCQASDVDDAVQETLLIISRKITGLRAAAAFSGWLFTVIRRECQKLTRAMLRHPTVEIDAVEAQLASKTDDALRIDLAAALDSLPAHYLEIILLRDFEEGPRGVYALYPPGRHLAFKVRVLVDFLVERFRGKPAWDQGW